MYPRSSNNPFYWYARCFRRFADFGGRSRRKEYWWFALINMLATLVLTVVGVVLADYPGDPVTSVPFYLYVAVVLVPSLAVSVRRLHDTGRSGLWVLLQAIPYVGPVVVFVFLVMDGDAGPNQYGPDPKAPAPVDLGDLEEVFA